MVLSSTEVQELLRLPFLQCVSAVLNRLFDTQLRPGNLDFCIGRQPVRLNRLGHRIFVGECWHSASGTFAESINRVCRLLGGENDNVECGWRRIGITSAFLCGLLGQMMRTGAADGKSGVNMAAMADDFVLLMSAWYVRSWGFPIRKILCCGVENDGLWELFHNGSFPTEETVPIELERFLYHMGGAAQIQQFSFCCQFGSVYTVDEEQRQKLCREMLTYTIGEQRIESIISGVFGSSTYVFGPKAAGAYAGAMDCRWRAGGKEPVLLLAENSPVQDVETVSRALRVPAEAFLSYWKNR